MPADPDLQWSFIFKKANPGNNELIGLLDIMILLHTCRFTSQRQNNLPFELLQKALVSCRLYHSCSQSLWQQCSPCKTEIYTISLQFYFNDFEIVLVPFLNFLFFFFVNSGGFLSFAGATAGNWSKFSSHRGICGMHGWIFLFWGGGGTRKWVEIPGEFSSRPGIWHAWLVDY